MDNPMDMNKFKLSLTEALSDEPTIKALQNALQPPFDPCMQPSSSWRIKIAAWNSRMLRKTPSSAIWRRRWKPWRLLLTTRSNRDAKDPCVSLVYPRTPRARWMRRSWPWSTTTCSCHWRSMTSSWPIAWESLRLQRWYEFLILLAPTVCPHRWWPRPLMIMAYFQSRDEWLWILSADELRLKWWRLVPNWKTIPARMLPRSHWRFTSVMTWQRGEPIWLSWHGNLNRTISLPIPGCLTLAFMAVFDESVRNKPVDGQHKLRRFLQFTSGDAKMR